MTARDTADVSPVDLMGLLPQAYARQAEFSAAAWTALQDERLAELMTIRVAQLNGCAFCLELHTRGATAAGVPARVLHAVAAWRESPLFDARDRAALALAEASVRPGRPGPDDDLLTEARRHLTERQLAAALLGLAAINSWTRIALASGATFSTDEGEADRLARRLNGSSRPAA